jgi:hypothetical protein
LPANDETLIICLHEIERVPNGNSPWVLPVELVESVLTRLQESDWEWSSLRDISAEGGRRLVVTIDDCRAGAMEWLLTSKFLKGRSITIFPIPLFIDRPALIPAQERYSQFGSWDQIEAALECGNALGCHTLGHSSLQSMTSHAVRQELSCSKYLLEQYFRCRVTHLAVPYGEEPETILEDARACGFDTVLATAPSLNGGNDILRGKLNRFVLRSDRDGANLPEALLTR